MTILAQIPDRALGGDVRQTINNVLSRPGWRSRRLPHVVCAWGDSRPTTVYNDSGRTSKGNRNPIVWANTMLGQRLVIGPNFGVSGERTDQALARVPDVIASASGLVHVWCGLNDIAQNYPTAASSGATAAANLISAVEAFREAGISCIVEAETGSNNLSPAQVIQVAELNARLYDYCERTPGVYLHDARSAVMDPAFSDTLVAFRTGYAYDGTHQSARGAFKHGQSLATLLQAIVPPRFGTLMCGRVENFAAGGYHLLTNGNFRSTSGGTAGTGVTGSVPSGFSALCSGSATASLSTQADANGNGNNILAAITFTAAGEYFRLNQSPSSSAWNFGDTVEAGLSLDVTGTPTGLSGAYLELISSTDASRTARDCYTVVSADAGPDVGYSAQFKTRPITISGTTKSFLGFYGYVVASGPGTVNVTYKQAYIRKRIETGY